MQKKAKKNGCIKNEYFYKKKSCDKFFSSFLHKWRTKNRKQIVLAICKHIVTIRLMVATALRQIIVMIGDAFVVT